MLDIINYIQVIAFISQNGTGGALNLFQNTVGCKLAGFPKLTSMCRIGM